MTGWSDQPEVGAPAAARQVVFADNQQPANDAQAAVARQRAASGLTDVTKPAGSPENPFYDRGDGAVPPPGSTYIDQSGQLQTAPAGAAPPTAPAAAAAAPAAPDNSASWDSQPVEDSPALARARADAKVRIGNDPDWIRAIDNGFAFGGSGIIDAAGAAGETGVHNFVANAMGFPDSGYGMSDAYQAVREQNMASDKQFSTAHPWESGALGVVGMAANPISKAGGKFLASAPTLTSALGRSALVGGGLGAAYGFGGADPGDHINGALTGGARGVATSPLAPIAGAIVSPAARAASEYLTTKFGTPQAGGALSFLGSGYQKWLASSRAAQSQAANDALRTAGIDPASLSSDDQAVLDAHIKAGRSGSDSAMSVAAGGLPTPVPISAGQMSGEPGQQLAENLALRGAGGPVGQSAQIVAKGFQTDQQAALRSNIDTIGTNLGGGFNTPPGQAGGRVSAALNASFDQSRAGVNAAYDAARAGAPVTLPAYDAQSLAGQVGGALDGYDPLNVPRVAREVGRLQSLSTAGADPNVSDLFAARTRLSNLRASNDPVEAGAAGKAVQAFDGAINSNLSDALFQGDPDTVAKWQAAIGQRRDFGNLFQGGDLINKLTERSPRNGTMQLAVDPHDASNYIFGRSGLGFVGRSNLYRDLGQMKSVLGADSPSWNAIRSEAFNRFAAAGEGPMDPVHGQQFSGVKFQKAWNQANAADPDLIGSLFNPQERAQIDRLAAVSARVTSPVTGGDNPSNTATAALALAKRLPLMALKGVPLIGEHIADSIDSANRARLIRDATIRAAPRFVRPPVAATAGAAALAPLTAAGMTGRRDAN
jgi:hypothetical protein